MTIHKSQGSEYPAVVIPLLSGPRMLMTIEIFCIQQLPRAKQCVTLVGDPYAFNQMEANTVEQKRYTALADRIRELSEAADPEKDLWDITWGGSVSVRKMRNHLYIGERYGI